MENHSDLQPQIWPAISCYCNTYGKVHTLQEVLKCFLQQDYKGPKELVIVNDLEQQELIYDHPEVTIINLKHRIIPLGKKFNTSISHCKYDILACWEDDDIYLPNHLTNAVTCMRDGIFHTGTAWFENIEKELIFTHNVYHATHVFTRDLFNKSGGYPEIDESRVDLLLIDNFKKIIGDYSKPMSPKNLTYIYRWASANCFHGSHWHDNVSENAGKYVQDLISNNRMPVGKINLVPNWKYDYVEIARNCANSYSKK